MIPQALRLSVGGLARHCLGLLTALIALMVTAQAATLTYAQPMISAFAPVSGPAGTVVTVTGSGFTGASSIWLGADRTIVPTVISDTLIRFTVSSKATTASVAVLNPQRAAFSPTQFKVGASSPPPPAAPTISSFTPASGPVGTRITVTGSGLTGISSARIGSSRSTAVTVSNSTQLSFLVPAGATSGTITIANATSSAVSSARYTVTGVTAPPPAITGFSPASGSVGTVVTVTGSGLSTATSAGIGSSVATSVSVTSDSQLSFVVPAAASSGSIVISTAAGSVTSAGSFTVTAVSPPPGGAMGATAAARLLSQGSFGGSPASVASTALMSYDQWFAAQLAAPSSFIAGNVAPNGGNWLPYWWKNVIRGNDQLRQRVALALSEILVVSDQSAAIQISSQSIPAYHDLLVRNAFGNFRSLLEQVTLSPAMGLYLNMMRSDKPDPALGSHADQNYAREIMQLFTVGLVKLNPDGSVQKDASGVGLPTYSQTDVENLARVFTGWGSAPTTHTGPDAWTYDTNVLLPMVAYETHHDTGSKTLLGGVTVPAGVTAAADLKIALDTLFNHPNVGPFIGRQLIERLVTSNPSPAYVQRVAATFNNNGSGVRGDLLAVVRAILTDPEAINPPAGSTGKLREPLLKLANLWRAFNASDASGGANEFAIVNDASTLFAQSPLHAPTVFNFFQSDYVRAGPLTKAGLVAPEFQITNENTLVLTANQLERQAYAFTDSTGTTYFTPSGYAETPGAVTLKTADWEVYAPNPATLVDELNLVLMAGQMPAAMKATLTGYVSAIPNTAAGYKAYRAAEAADLIINSSQYAIQH